MADIGKPVRRYKVIPVTEPERRSIPAPSRDPGVPATQPPVKQPEPERV